MGRVGETAMREGIRGKQVAELVVYFGSRNPEVCGHRGCREESDQPIDEYCRGYLSKRTIDPSGAECGRADQGGRGITNRLRHHKRG